MRLSTNNTLALISLIGGVAAFSTSTSGRSRIYTARSAPASSTSLFESLEVETNVEKIKLEKPAVASNTPPTNNDDGATITENNEDGSKSLPLPGLEENFKFNCTDSVDFWRNFQSDGFWSARENLRAVGNIGTRFAQLGPEGWSYWLKHVGRMGYFGTNALLGSAAFNLHEQLVNKNNQADSTSGGGFPLDLDSSVATRLVLEACLCYEQDYAAIHKEGQYKEPWDMKINHRQSSPINVATQTGRFISEAIGTLGRRKRGEQKDKDIWITDAASPSLYPDYYRTAFHYQSDGWMSKRSADVYETSTETLFLGRQDSMQRTSLPPLVAYANRNAGQRPMKILEVAAGTGRFMTFVRDNLPLDTEYTAIDLSPYYLDRARENDLYWRKTRREEENQKGRTLGKDDIKAARLVQAQAENLPFEDESFDAVVCVYLYHELPREVRAKVSEEMSRVLKQDGIVVFTDSIQRGDRPVLDAGLTNFEKMNEPYYVDYLQDDLPGHFEKYGLQPMTKTIRSTTKSLSFLKPTCEVGACETLLV